MQNSKIYLDHNATSKLLPEVASTMNELSQSSLANPSSPHWAGREARNILEDSRAQLANYLGVKPREIFYTSGGSESNNTVIRQLLLIEGKKHLISSPVEHPSVLETCEILAKQQNIEFTKLNVNSKGEISTEELRKEIRPETFLISVMSANNETGNLHPIEELCKISKEKNILFHTDITQSFCKINFDLGKIGADYATATAHKIGGPCGIGLLYVKDKTPIYSLITGGEQERARRAGTENVILAVGFSKAVEWFFSNQSKLNKNFVEFRKFIFEKISKQDEVFINTNLDNSLPHTLNFGLHGISAESLLISLDMDGIAVSTGSACSSGSLEASPVLLAMGISHSDAKSSLRISCGWSTTKKEIDYFCERLIHHIYRIKKKQNPN